MPSPPRRRRRSIARSGRPAEIAVKLAVGAGARLSWLPQETILFDRARLKRSIEVDLAADATLLMAEAVVFGRSAMGEAVEQGAFTDRWRVRRDGRLVFAETVRLDGAIARMLREPAVAGGGVAIATVLAVPGDAGDGRARRARKLSVARSGSRPGTGLRWRASAPRMARACGAIWPR